MIRELPAPSLGLMHDSLPKIEGFETAAQFTNHAAVGHYQHFSIAVLPSMFRNIVEPGIQPFAQLARGFATGNL